MFALSKKADIRPNNRYVRFTPESGHVQCTSDVRFVPIADPMSARSIS